MRFMFKTDYEDDIKLFPHGGYIVTYGILLAFLAIAPFVLVQLSASASWCSSSSTPPSASG